MMMTMARRCLSKRSKRRRSLPRVSTCRICYSTTIEATVDEADIKEVHTHFAGYFTLDQVKDTLMANKDDPEPKAKTIRDLKYRQGKRTSNNLQ
jgi:hypothetical protein